MESLFRHHTRKVYRCYHFILSYSLNTTLPIADNINSLLVDRVGELPPLYIPKLSKQNNNDSIMSFLYSFYVVHFLDHTLHYLIYLLF